MQVLLSKGELLAESLTTFFRKWTDEGRRNGKEADMTGAMVRERRSGLMRSGCDGTESRTAWVEVEDEGVTFETRFIF